MVGSDWLKSKNRQKNTEKRDKNNFFSFIFPILLSFISRPSLSIVLCANQKLERKTCNARLTCDIWDVRKFVFYPEKCSLLAEVSHYEAKMRERRETSAGFRRVFYHACACVFLTTSDVFVTCDTTHRTGLRETSRNVENPTISQIWGKRGRPLSQLRVWKRR